MRVEKPSGKKHFEEEQLLRQSWVLLLVAGVLAIAVAANIHVLRNAIHQRTPTPQWLLWAGIATPMIPLFFLYFARLETVITDDGVYFRWRPLRKKYKVIPFSSLHKVKVTERVPTKLGGSYALGYGWIHQVRGRQGVEMENGGERLWLGTQRLQPFLYALEKASNGKIEIVEKQQK